MELSPKKSTTKSTEKNITLDSLSPNPRNPRKISKEQKDRLHKSIVEFGDLSGIIFNRTTKQLVGGHQRVDVLKSLASTGNEIKIEREYDKPNLSGTIAEGFVMIEGERYSYREVVWDEIREKAANIAANKHGGEFDIPKLNDWLLELDAMNYDMDLVGFSKEELANLMAPVQKLDPKEAPDSVPSIPKVPKSQRGQIFALGNHRLMCGDSCDIAAVEELLDGTKPEIIYTDPPYGVSIVDGPGRNRLRELGYGVVEGDNSTQVAIDAFNLAFALQIPVMIFWGANYYASSLPNSPCWIVWDKQGGKSIDFADCELAWTNTKKPARIFQHIWDGFRRESEKGDKRVHPTQKPVALAEWCIDRFAPDAKAVLDLFGGSGSTMIACELKNKACFMMELSESYVDVIIERWIKFTGKEVYRINPDTSATNWKDIL